MDVQVSRHGFRERARHTTGASPARRLTNAHAASTIGLDGVGALDIVLRSGRTVTVNGPARGQASSATLAAIGRVAAHHQVPAPAVPERAHSNSPHSKLWCENTSENARW